MWTVLIHAGNTQLLGEILAVIGLRQRSRLAIQADPDFVYHRWG